MSWAERAADRSPVVHRTRSRSIQQAKVLLDAARRLIGVKGGRFTTQELVKEAGVSMKTFYLHFAGKDQLLVALIEDMTTEEVARYEEAARDLPDPFARLRHHIMAVLSLVEVDEGARAGARFVTSEHWRLHQLFPEEMTRASKPYVDLLARELRAAQEAGLLPPTDIERAAVMVTRLVMSVFHHQAFSVTGTSAEEMGEYLWEFCLGGLRRGSGTWSDGAGRAARSATAVG